MLEPALRSPKERSLFILGVIFSSVFWLCMVVSVVGIAYAVLIVLFAFVARALMLARIRGDGVRLSPRQMPALYARCEQAAARMGLRAVPEVFVIQSDGALNAFATRFLARDFVVLYADLLERCHDPRQADFVIGHEMGHLAAGHVTWRVFLAPFMLVPWLGPAYSRACEYTCDRCGNAAAGNLDAAMRGLVVLSAGHVADRVDLDAYVDQRGETEGFWEGVYELVSTHPHLTKRAAALKALDAPASALAPSRHPMAWVLGPFFGIVAGTPASAAMLLALYVGMVGAFAMPAVSRFAQMQARSPAPSSREPRAEAPQDLAAPLAHMAPRGPYTTEPGPIMAIEEGVTRQEVVLRRGAHTARVWIYRPRAAHPPVVLVPPAGGIGIVGMALVDGDAPEQLPWARAGFVVVSSDLDGPRPAGDGDDAAWAAAARAYRASEGGVLNLREALDTALELTPDADATRIVVAGHSSAGAQSLMVAASDPRIRLCVAFMPVTDWAARIRPSAVRAFRTAVPDLEAFLRAQSPAYNAAAIRVPVFLTAAEDDRTVPVATVRAFADSLRANGGDVELTVFPDGGHYEPMIRDGVPAAIAWARQHLGLPADAPSAPAAPRRRHR